MGRIRNKTKHALKRSFTFKDGDKVAWQGPLCVTLICCVMGIPFFFGFYYGMVVPEQDKLDRTTKETCLITTINDGKYDCSQRTGCTCIGCGTNPQCSTREGTIGDNGECCGESCCASYHDVHYSCTKYVCYGCSGDDKCCRRWVYNGCSNKECAVTSVERCTVTWGDCWTVIVHYHILEESTEPRTFSHNCGYNDQACVNQIHADYPTNQTKSCWLDPKHNTVSFSSPGEGDLKGGWVGAGFGIAFLSIATIAFCWGFSVWCWPRCKHQIDHWKEIQAEKKRKWQQQAHADAEATATKMRNERTVGTSSKDPSPVFGSHRYSQYGEQPPAYQLPPPENPGYSTQYTQGGAYGMDLPTV